jgi:ferric-dicitrate binding protein FerR (iron transport regulator)
MTGLSRFASISRLKALAMTALLLGGCSTWRMQGQAPATAVSATASPPHVRVTLLDGTRLEMYQAAVQGDSLVEVDPDAWPPRIAVALSDIRALEVRTHSGGKTTLLVAGIAVGLLALWVYVIIAWGASDGVY